MKLIKFVRDFKTPLNLPRAPLLGLDKEYKIGDVLHPKGTRMVVNNDRARHFCKTVLDLEHYEKTGKMRRIPVWAVVLKDLGLHFGTSKHIYLKDGRSEIYGRRRKGN